MMMNYDLGEKLSIEIYVAIHRIPRIFDLTTLYKKDGEKYDRNMK